MISDSGFLHPKQAIYVTLPALMNITEEGEERMKKLEPEMAQYALTQVWQGYGHHEHTVEMDTCIRLGTFNAP